MNEPIKIDDKILKIPPLGFQNTGAICYFNSLIQCLISSNNFLNFILFDKENAIFKEFLTNIVNDKWDTTFTTSILQTCNMIQPNQSSSEYFIFLVDFFKLENIFECQHLIVTTCNNCKRTKESKDISYNILINENIEEFFEYSEQVQQVNCDFCHVKSDMERKKVVCGLPPVIVLSLNKYFGKKQILYPSSFSSTEIEYRLIGTVEHVGGLQGGHYVSRFMRNDEYYLADDANTRQLPDLNPIPETYMVFYERLK